MPGIEQTDNFYRARQIDPERFEDDTFRTISLGDGIKAVVGRLKGEEKTTVQTILFPVERYDMDQVQDWLKKHRSKFGEAVDLEMKKKSLFTESPEEERISRMEKKLDMLMSMVMDKKEVDFAKHKYWRME